MKLSLDNNFNPGNGEDWCDNVLLEWKLGLNLVQMDEYPLQAIYPIMVGSEDLTQKYKMKDFFAEQGSLKFADTSSEATDAELRRWLPNAVDTLGLSVSETKAPKPFDPRKRSASVRSSRVWSMRPLACASAF